MGKAARAMRWEEVEKLEAYCKANNRYRDWLLIVLSCSTGFRFAEIQRLKWKDLANKKTITLAQGKQGGRKRTVELHEKVQIAFRMAYGSHAASLAPSKIGMASEYYIFRSVSNNSTGKPMTRAGANDAIRRICLAAGVDPNTTVHSQRKAWAIRMYNLLGGDDHALNQVSMWLDHRDTATTRRYLGFTQVLKEETIAKLWE